MLELYKMNKYYKMLSLIFICCFCFAHHRDNNTGNQKEDVLINNHNKDSLTTDTCLCKKRLLNIYSYLPADSFDMDYHPFINNKGYLLFTMIKSNSFFGSYLKIIINDSCKIIGWEVD
jgi:hypothetical protein